jgi:hypothetical protein
VCAAAGRWPGSKTAFRRRRPEGGGVVHGAGICAADLPPVPDVLSGIGKLKPLRNAEILRGPAVGSAQLMVILVGGGLAARKLATPMSDALLPIPADVLLLAVLIAINGVLAMGSWRSCRRAGPAQGDGQVRQRRRTMHSTCVRPRRFLSTAQSGIR